MWHQRQFGQERVNIMQPQT
ncbi:Uncharacterised protein at_DN0554, partial [Pycnogonum litorale]